MTTVVYKDGAMAADSQGTLSGDRWGSTFNINKMLKHGTRLFGATGSVLAMNEFYAWIAAGEQPTFRPRHTKGTLRALEWDGKQLWLWKMSPESEKSALSRAFVWLFFRHPPRYARIPLDDKFAAIGSGGGYALGALEMGADVVEAIQAASRHDLYTNADVRVLRLPAAAGAPPAVLALAS